MAEPTLRPYDRESEADRRALWRLKVDFERSLGSGTGDDAKAARYESKLTEGYRDRWLAWVDLCVGDEPGCVTVADDGDALVGYAFVLPERLAFVWDAAVVNELYVEPRWRGRGAADDLLEAALALARDQELPLDRVLLDVDPDNERARAFFERHGFEPWGEIVAREL